MVMTNNNQQFGQHLEQRWLADNRIVYYKITSPLRAVVNQWADVVVETVTQWPADEPYLAIHDLSTPGVSFLFSQQIGFFIGQLGITQAGEDAVQRLIAERPDFQSRLAILLNQQHSAQVVQVLSARHLANTSNHQVHTFSSEERAIAWLQS